MTNPKDKLVVGAGPAGLTAAINLRREGYHVVVREKQARVGGEPGWHPSVHTTPVATPALYDYIGIDLTEAFVDSNDVYTHIERKRAKKGYAPTIKMGEVWFDVR